MNRMPNEGFSINDCHLAAPLDSIAADRHLPLQPLLHKLWVASQALKLDPETRFTSLVILHRYHARQLRVPVHDHENDDDYKWIGAAALVLGMKAEEQVRRLRDVINMAHMLDFGLHSPTSPILMDVPNQPPELNSEYWKAKEQIVATEQEVLRVLQFDTLVSHPHRLVLLLIDQLPVEFPPDIAAKAWTRLNDALFHAPALTHTALTLACAAIALVHNIAEQAKLFGDKVGDVKAAMRDLNEATEQLRKGLSRA